MSTLSSPGDCIRYSMLKVAPFSPRFSDQAGRNLQAAVPVWHSHHYGVNEISSSTYCSCKPVSKPHTAQVSFCLLSPRLESTQVTFSCSYILNRRAAQQITQQRPALMYIPPARDITQGFKLGTRKDTYHTQKAPLIHKTSSFSPQHSLPWDLPDLWSVASSWTACECVRVVDQRLCQNHSETAISAQAPTR